MFVVFEGIDGSGKTTVSNIVAKRLRDSGLVVEHVREGGSFASRVTQALRELGRDSRNLALTPRAELMLYLTREVQLLEEATKPALERADIVIADRFVQTAEVLAVAGRGLPQAEVESLVSAAVGGMRPDLTILVDVDPRIARARRQVSKIITADKKLPSRKGMAGPALQRRLREGYRQIAARDDRWILVDNTDAELDAMVDHVFSLLRTARDKGVAKARALELATAHRGLEVREPAAARETLLSWIDHRGKREPGLAAYFLDGLSGPDVDPRRRVFAETVPAVIAAGLKYMTDPVSWELRRSLISVVPGLVAKSISGPAVTDEGNAMLESVIDKAPLEVASALYSREDATAWRLRDRLSGDAKVISLGGVSSERAWPIRNEWLERANLDDPRQAAIAAASVEGVPGEKAWDVRKAARHHAPVPAIDSIIGLADDRAWKWRHRHIDRALKVVIRSLALVDDPRAWELRQKTHLYCEEVMDTIIGSEDPRAWQIRESVLDRWPSAAVKSLGLIRSPRADALVSSALAHAPRDVALWRQIVLRS
ncbi:MAG TPA: dTMP kinase [Kofleriaceae bacterium]|nr:dTMP kinase [Kofleriaceae bacterium]